MHKRFVAAVSLLLAAAVMAGCGGAKPQDVYKSPAGQQGGTQQGGTQQGGGNQSGGQPQAQQPAPAKQWSEPPAMAIDKEKSYTATIETSLGTMKLELFASEVPQTVNNFVFLAREGFYDGVVFHRIIKDFMIQGGDPTGTGSGGPGYTIPDEYPVTREYKRGTLAMARTAQPNSAGSQFFICTGADCGGLGRQPDYVIFGQVIEGDDVLTKLENVEVVRGNQFDPVPSTPKDPPVIKTITIDEK